MSDHPGCYWRPTRLVFVVNEHEGNVRPPRLLLETHPACVCCQWTRGKSTDEDGTSCTNGRTLKVRWSRLSSRCLQSAMVRTSRTTSRADPWICLSVTGGPRNLPVLGEAKHSPPHLHSPPLFLLPFFPPPLSLRSRVHLKPARQSGERCVCVKILVCLFVKCSMLAAVCELWQ